MKRLCTLLAIMMIGIIPASAATIIAVLPYKISYEGRVPTKFTAEELAASRLQDGRNYQASMINYLHKMNRKRSNIALDVTILSQGQIDALLTRHNLTASQLDSLTNTEIAGILGVTHVVRGSATRTFIMSDELSLGITAVGVLTKQPLPAPTSAINIINSLENVQSNSTLFSREFNRNTTALHSDDQSLRDTFRKASRRMFKALKTE